MKLSKQIEIWRDVMMYYEDNTERQQQLFDELVRELKKQIMPPPKCCDQTAIKPEREHFD